MAITYPYSLAFLADQLCITDVVWDIQRNDELSGTGDGRVWQAELAPPLWKATINVAVGYHEDIKKINAKIRRLYGSQEAFFLYDPTSQYPQYDPTGSILGSNVVTISGINTERDSIAITGLPPNYQITAGDKISIADSSAPTRYAFLEFSEDATAASNGALPLTAVFPFVPTGVTVGLAVTLIKPFCKMILIPGTHNPGQSVYRITSGLSFQAIQKK